jgi:hypothetical protein
MATETLSESLETPASLPRRYRSLAETARRFPPSRNGRPVHVATITRWINDGVRGRDGQVIRLRATRLPGRWVVTDAAIDEFLDALTRDRADNTAPTTVSPGTTTDVHPPARRRREIERTSRKLDEFGIR